MIRVPSIVHIVGSNKLSKFLMVKNSGSNSLSTVLGTSLVLHCPQFSKFSTRGSHLGDGEKLKGNKGIEKDNANNDNNPSTIKKGLTSMKKITSWKNHDKKEVLDSFFASPDIFTAVFIAERHKDIDDLIKVYYTLKEHKIDMDLRFLACLIVRLDRTGRRSMIGELWADILEGYYNMKQYDKPLNEFTYNTIIPVFANRGQIGKAIELLEDMKKRKYLANEVALHLVLRACGKKKYVDKAMQIFNSMELDFDVTPNSKHYTSMIRILFDTGRINEASQVFKKFREKIGTPDIIMWTQLIKLLGENHQIEHAFELYDEMISEGIKPDEHLILVLLHICKKNKMHQKALQIFDTMGDTYNIEASISHYSNILDILSDADDVDSALLVFNKLKDKADVVMWNIIIKALAKKNRPETMQLFDEMVKRGIKPNDLVLRTILVACKLPHLVDKGIQIFSDMEANFGVKPTIAHLTIILESLFEAGRIDDALTMVDSMRDYGLVFDKKLYCSIIVGLGKNGKAMKIFDLVSRMRDEGIYIDEVVILNMLNSLKYSNCFERALKLFDNMKNEYGVSPNNRHRFIIAEILGKIGELNKAQRLLLKINMMDFPSWKSQLFSSIYHKNLETGEFAYKELKKINSQDNSLEPLLWKLYINCRLAKDQNEARNLMNERDIH